ncbi:MAG: amidase [Candidatus Tectomicrobia bacterium]
MVNKAIDNFGAFVEREEIFLPGKPNGPLEGLRFAVKDLFDIAGHVTGCGNPDWLNSHGPAESTAFVVQQLVEAGATMIGKTHTDELAYSLFGENFHYGTPVNPRAPGRVPGGSSSGSAVVAAAGLVDFSIGSDTGGSVRVPAGFCGVLGIRSSHGRIPFEGCMPLAPIFDTVGWFSQNAEVFERVGQVLLSETPGLKKPSGFLLAEDLLPLLEPSARDAITAALRNLERILGPLEPISLAAKLEDWRYAFLVIGGSEIWRTHGDWITKTQPRFGPLIQERFAKTSQVTTAQVAQKKEVCAQAVAVMAELLNGEKVLFLPTAPGPAPRLNSPTKDVENFRQRILSLTSIAVLGRLPQVNLPLAQAEGAPLGISMIAAHGNDMLLLGMTREIMKADLSTP